MWKVKSSNQAVHTENSRKWHFYKEVTSPASTRLPKKTFPPWSCLLPIRRRQERLDWSNPTTSGLERDFWCLHFSSFDEDFCCQLAFGHCCARRIYLHLHQLNTELSFFQGRVDTSGNNCQSKISTKNDLKSHIF